MPQQQIQTLREVLLAEYLIRLQALNYSPFTIRLYRLAVEKLIATYRTVSFEIMTPEHIERHLYDRPIGPRSKGQELRYLRTFFTYLVKQKRLLPKNPCDGVEPPRWTPRLRPSPSFADFKTLCATCRTLEEAVLVRLYFQTALRLREALRLRVMDVDLHGREVRVIRGKGGEDRVAVFDPPEMPARLRLGPKATAFVAGRPSSAWLFPRPRNSGLPRSHEWVNTTLRRLGQEAGLPYRLTAHLLRHGWVRWAKTSGLPIPIAQRLLGHKDIRTTDRLYGAVDASDLRRAVDRFMRPPGS